MIIIKLVFIESKINIIHTEFDIDSDYPLLIKKVNLIHVDK